MSETPKHRAHEARHKAQTPDDPARIDLDALFPGTKSSLPQNQKHKQPRPSRKGRATAITAAAATGTIALIVSMATTKTPAVEPAAASEEQEQPTPEVELQPSVQTEPIPIQEPDSPKVSSEAAPPPPPPPVEVPKPAPAPPKATTPAPVVAEAAPAPQAPAPVAAPVTDKGAQVRAAIVAAAYAQIGESQDCVKMVADALAQVGIYWYKWPVEYYQIGHAIPASQALPGDLIYYVNGMGASIGGLAHIAIYVGDGMAIHGGWNGWTTIKFSANVGSGPNYIRLNV